eukprot:m.160041 g.160041  ORF g.160041 m.160041 type:complete len:74 (+) comp24811_c0_seq1:208-429(+)
MIAPSPRKRAVACVVNLATFCETVHKLGALCVYKVVTDPRLARPSDLEVRAIVAINMVTLHGDVQPSGALCIT